MESTEVVCFYRTEEWRVCRRYGRGSPGGGLRWSLQSGGSALQTVSWSYQRVNWFNWGLDCCRLSPDLIKQLSPVWSPTPRLSPDFTEALPCKCNISVTIYTTKIHKWSRDDGRAGALPSEKINMERMLCRLAAEMRSGTSAEQYLFFCETLLGGGYLVRTHTHIKLHYKSYDYCNEYSKV